MNWFLFLGRSKSCCNTLKGGRGVSHRLVDALKQGTRRWSCGLEHLLPLTNDWWRKQARAAWPPYASSDFLGLNNSASLVLNKALMAFFNAAYLEMWPQTVVVKGYCMKLHSCLQSFFLFIFTGKKIYIQSVNSWIGTEINHLLQRTDVEKQCLTLYTHKEVCLSVEMFSHWHLVRPQFVILSYQSIDSLTQINVTHAVLGLI